MKPCRRFNTTALLQSCKILRLRASLFARHFAQDDRAACRRCLVPATFRCIRFRESGVRSALFREQALLHYQAYCAASGSVPQQGSANGRYYITKPIARTTIQVYPPTVISTEARSRATSEAEKSLTLYDCFCNEHGLAYTNRAFIAYPGDFSTAHGLIPCSARNDMRSLPTLCHSEPPRMRRVEESA